MFGYLSYQRATGWDIVAISDRAQVRSTDSDVVAGGTCSTSDTVSDTSLYVHDALVTCICPCAGGACRSCQPRLNVLLENAST